MILEHAVNLLEHTDFLHLSIALYMLYQSSFESNSIRPRFRPQISKNLQEANRWR